MHRAKQTPDIERCMHICIPPMFSNRDVCAYNNNIARDPNEQIPWALIGLLQGHFCAWAESMKSAMGIADRQGLGRMSRLNPADRHGWNKNNAYRSRGQCRLIPCQAKPVFAAFDSLFARYSLLKCVKMSKLGRFELTTTTTTDRQYDYLTLCTYARGDHDEGLNAVINTNVYSICYKYFERVTH